MAFKILFVTASPADVFGGGKKVFYSLITGLNKDVFQPVVACAPGGLYADMLMKAGIEICPVDMSNRYDLRNVFRLAKIMRNESVHIVHSQGGGRSNFFAMLAARLAKVPIKLVTAATLVERWEDTSSLRRACYIKVDRVIEDMVDRFICVSEEVRQALVHGHGLSPERAITVHNGIDVSGHESPREADEIRQSLHVSSDKIIISLLGRLVWVKGIDLFLQAAANLCKTHENVYFLVVGDGPLASALKEQEKELGLQGKCSFTGFQKDIPAILKITDILAIPSHSEGLPMVILEAMACGIPVVGSQIGGIPEMIEPGTNGFLIPPADAKSLAEKLSLLVNDKYLREKMGRAARGKVEESFSEAKMIHETEKVYLDMIKEKVL